MGIKLKTTKAIMKKKDKISFSIIQSVKNGEFQLICLETDIAVAAKTKVDAVSKMKDALTSYLDAFSKEEIKRYKFLRLAPNCYQMRAYNSKCMTLELS